MEESRLIPVGKIARTHGIRGLVKILPYGESLALQGAGEKVFLAVSLKETPETLTIVSAKSQGKMLLVQFQDLTSIDEAKGIVGLEVLLPEDRLPPTQDDEYYHYQLIGLEVVTKQGDRIGVLRGIIETGGNDVYSIDRNGRELLVPAVEGVIADVDLQQNRMVIDPPEGLMDDL
jgi:16S rRNA processing protein RimM